MSTSRELLEENNKEKEAKCRGSREVYSSAFWGGFFAGVAIRGLSPIAGAFSAFF